MGLMSIARGGTAMAIGKTCRRRFSSHFYSVSRQGPIGRPECSGLDEASGFDGAGIVIYILIGGFQKALVRVRIALVRPTGPVLFLSRAAVARMEASSLGCVLIYG
jgi:hypothetical protein